ncbi:hypothetical protein F2P81_012277 [Scophthalmus maximus]|uniref:Uncharacterized protein n=1 Tax=Scophthalmus maximus TaxID=52904 RepID=A0A6A4SP86_SCOMX|nr:hypothetical protein F2P81_012277 [Scophthalmus maximus]
MHKGLTVQFTPCVCVGEKHTDRQTQRAQRTGSYFVSIIHVYHNNIQHSENNRQWIMRDKNMSWQDVVNGEAAVKLLAPVLESAWLVSNRSVSSFTHVSLVLVGE